MSKLKMSKKRVIIGLMGTIGSGKTYVSDYLIQKYKFYKISMGDLVREKADELKIKRTRENLQKLAEEYRQKYGKNYWVKEVFKKIKKYDKEYFLIDGIRTPIEAETAKKNSAFLILVDAKPNLRHKRIIERAREGEEKDTIEQIQAEDRKEWKIFNLKKTFSYAEYKILNNSTKKSLENKIDIALRKLFKN